MQKLLIIGLLSSFCSLVAMDSCGPFLEKQHPNLGSSSVLITRHKSEKDRGRSGRLSSISIGGSGENGPSTPAFKRISSGQNLQELMFTFPGEAPEGLSAKEEEDLSDSTTSLSSVVEVTLQLAEAIESEVALTGDQDGKPFVLVLAQAKNNENLLLIKADPSSSSGKIHGSSFLPGMYVRHKENYLTGTVTIVTLERLGNTMRQVFTTLGKEGEVLRRVWGGQSEYKVIDQQPHLRRPIDIKLCSSNLWVLRGVALITMLDD